MTLYIRNGHRGEDVIDKTFRSVSSIKDEHDSVNDTSGSYGKTILSVFY